MSEKLTFRKVLNHRDVKHPAAKGVLLGAATAFAAGNVISGWLHRSTHGGVEYSERVKKVLRGANFMLTGMPKIDWVDHLAHHAYPDKYDQEAHESWNHSRPNGAPEAPKEAFRDPYSCELEGYPKVLFNTSGLHRKAKKAIVPWLRQLEQFDKDKGLDPNNRSHWPEPYRRVDMEEGDPSAIRNRFPIMGLVALGIGEAALGGIGVALPAMAIHVPAILGIGGDINAINHTGQARGFINRARVIAGLDRPIPDENGFFAANIMTGNEGLVVGEQHHKYHHDHPQDPFISGTTLLRDPPGWIINTLEKFGLASTPGAPTK